MDMRTRLNSAMQAVDVFMDIDGHPVRAVVPREVFERCLNSESTPADWLRACEENADLLGNVIRRRHAARTQDFVVVRASDFAALAARRISL